MFSISSYVGIRSRAIWGHYLWSGPWKERGDELSYPSAFTFAEWAAVGHTWSVWVPVCRGAVGRVCMAAQCRGLIPCVALLAIPRTYVQPKLEDQAGRGSVFHLWGCSNFLALWYR